MKENQTFVFKALKDSDRRRALLSIVGFPYLQSVLDRQYTLINEENTSSSNQHVHLKKIKAIFKTVYPIFDTMTRGLKFVYMFLFLFEFTGFFSPWLHLTRQQFRRMSMQDIVMISYFYKNIDCCELY